MKIEGNKGSCFYHPINNMQWKKGSHEDEFTEWRGGA